MANMNDLQVALDGFWNQFTNVRGESIPAFREGYAPTQQAFPYITYEFGRGAWQSERIVNANIWTRQPANIGFLGTANHIANQIEEVIQEGLGAKINVGESGFLWFKRNGAFIQLMPPDPDDQAIVRYLVTLTVQSIIV